MERIKSIRAFWKKYWTIVWLITAITCAVSLITYAEFDFNKNRVKRVVANVASGGQMFSSDRLDRSELTQRVQFSAGTNGYCEVHVKIWNYNVSNPLKAYQGDLSYTLKATLVKRVVVEGETENDPDTIEYQPITQAEFNSLVIPANPDDSVIKFEGQNFVWKSDSLESAYVVLVPNAQDDEPCFTKDAENNYVPAQHDYTIQFPESMLANNDNLYVKLVATPTNQDINLSEISGIIGVQTASAALPQGWTGYFNDDKSYVDYDAFNYVFSGNGTKEIIFKWCTDYLEVSQICLEAYELTAESVSAPEGASGTWKGVKIDADANTKVNRYDFQLYMTGDPSEDYGDPTLASDVDGSFWKTVESYVYDNLPKQ